MATKLGTLTLDLVAKIGNFTQGMRQASSSAEREMQRASSSVNVMNGMLGKLAATAGAVFSINQVKNYADSYTEIVNKLKLVTDGQAELNTAMADTYRIAQATASGWDAVNDVYSKYMANAKKLNLTQAETARLTEITSKAVAISGSSAQAANGALFQYGQTLDGNILRAQEYNSLVDGAGGLLNAMAKGLNVTRGELRQMMLDGKLTGEVITRALLDAGDSVDDLYSKTATTATASLNLLKTEATKLIGEFDTAVGSSQEFVKGVKLLAENMSNLAGVAMVSGAYLAGTYIPVVMKGTQAIVADTVGKVTNTLASRAKALADYDVARSNLAATAAMVRAMGVTNAQTVAMMSNARAAYQQAAAAKAAAVASTGVSSVLLGPVGLGVAVASVAAGYLMMRDGADESTKSLRENNESVDDAIKKYKELDEVKRRAQLVSEKSTLQDLAKEYDEVNSKLITATYSFSRHNDMTSEQSKQVNALIAEYKKTGDIDQFSGKINALNFINQTGKDRFNTLAGSVKTAGNEFKSQKAFVSQMDPALKSVGDQAKQTAIETANLSEEIKKLLKASGQNIKDSAITSALANRGYNDTMIELAKKYLNVEGAIVKNEQGRLSLRADLQKMFTTEYNEVMKAKNATDARNEAEKKITQEKEKQAKLTKASTIDAVISSGEGNYNSVNLGQKGGYKASTRNLTDMTVAQILSAQRAKEFNAAGKYQTINSTLQEAVDKGVVSSAEKFTAEVQERIFKQYLVAIKRPEIKGFITGSNKATLNDALLGSAKEFASVANPSTGKSYYAGQGNNKASISAEKMTESLLAQQKVYRENIALGMDSEQAWLKSFNTSTTVVKTEELDLDKFLEDMIKRKQEQADEQKAIQVSYYNEWQNLEYDNQERIKEIEKAFATDPTERDRLLGLQQKAYEDDVANWIKAQDERVKAENEANQQIILARQNAFAMMNGPLGAMVQMGVEASARASMKPEEYQRWQLGNEQQDGYSQLADNLYSAREGIQNDEYTTDTEKYQQLEQAYEVYLQNKAALSEAYSKQEQDLAKTQYESQLSLWGNLLGQAQNTWSQMTQAVKDSEGEQSGAFKAMFLAQQMFAMGSALISTHLAATQVAADATIPFFGAKIAASKAMLAMGYANVGLIAGQTIAGMAHDGIDNIPKEGTWLLDKGERVVDSRTNADLKGMIANQKNGGGDVHISVHVTDSGVTTQSNQADQKQLGQMIGNAVRTVIRQEQRQGGLLAK